MRGRSRGCRTRRQYRMRLPGGLPLTTRGLAPASRRDAGDQRESTLDLAPERGIFELQRPRLVHQRVVERAAQHLEREPDLFDIRGARRTTQQPCITLD